jgi:flagellar hook-associated protein 1 FlgK
MTSTFFGLNTALSGILTHQRALNTTTHNLVNADTQGYTRQRVTMRATPAFPMPALNNAVGPGQIGTGVAVVEYARLRDQFTDLQFRAQNASFGQYEARSDALNRLDQVVDEPGDTGLTSLLNRFWAGWQSLSTQAESPAVREAVRSAATALSQGFQDTRAQLVTSQGEADARITASVTQVNEIAAQINQLNQAISKVVAVNQDPNDLMDQRDLLIDTVAKQANIAVTPVGTTGRVTVALGGQVLVDGATNTTQALAVSAAGVVTVGAATATLSDGALRGLVDIRDTVIGGPNGYIAGLDLLAQTIIAEVNTRHAAGVALDGTAGNAFFAGGDAATIGLSAAVAGSTDKIAAAAAAGDLPAGGDNAVSLAQLKYVSLTIGAGTSTIDGFWGTMVSRLGLDVDQSERLAAVQQDVLDNAIARRDAVSGVNQDEEAADMIRFQKSYNAAARMVTTLDSMLETIVSGMGLVGR